MVVDFWAHAFIDNPKLCDQEHNPDFEDDLADLEAKFLAERKVETAPAAPDNDWEVVSDVTYGNAK
jgi:hypothetical protein